jgi:hypothetical protein
MRSSWLYLFKSELISLPRWEAGSLCQAFASARCAGLDLAGAKAHHEVGNECVFCFAAAVADHGAPSRGKGEESGFDAFRHSPDLIHFEKQRVARFSVDASLDTRGVGHEQIIANL